MSLETSALVSWGCHTRLHKLDGKLKTTDVYFLRVLEASIKSRCRQDSAPFEELREKISLAFYKLLVVAGSLWCSSCL